MFGRPSIKLIESQGPARRGMQLHLPPLVWPRKQRRAAAALTAGPPPRGLINGYSIPDTQIIKLNFPRGLIQILGGWWMVVIQYSIYPFSSVYCMHVYKISNVANFSLLPNQISDGRCFIWIAQHICSSRPVHLGTSPRPPRGWGEAAHSQAEAILGSSFVSSSSLCVIWSLTGVGQLDKRP